MKSAKRLWTQGEIARRRDAFAIAKLQKAPKNMLTVVGNSYLVDFGGDTVLLHYYPDQVRMTYQGEFTSNRLLVAGDVIEAGFEIFAGDDWSVVKADSPLVGVAYDPALHTPIIRG